MSVYRTSVVLGSSPAGFDQALKNALDQVAKNVPVAWFELMEQRGTVADGVITEYQVKILVGFRMEDER